jgi:transposase InsO family protein
MAEANRWGAPRIHGELLKLGIDIGERGVSRFMPPKLRRPPSQTWRTFLDNYVGMLESIDFFTVPTATFRVPYVFFVLAHDRRRVLHFSVTEHTGTAWTAQQIVEAFPEDTAPKCMVRDRDGIYSDEFRRRVEGIGIDEVLTAPQSPWQNPYAERLVGSLRRECLNHVIVLGEPHLYRILKSYFAYYHGPRTHLSLRKDAPDTRTVHLPSMGEVVELPEIGAHSRFDGNFVSADDHRRHLLDLAEQRVHRARFKTATRARAKWRMFHLCSLGQPLKFLRAFCSMADAEEESLLNS